MKTPALLAAAQGLHKERMGFPMQHDFTTDNVNQIPIKDGVVVLSGYGVIVNVEKGFLILKDGLGFKSRKGRFFKATCNIKRLVIHGTHGMISLAALKWLYDINASIIHLGWDGETIYSSTNSRESINLKRAQYSALYNGSALKLTKYLMMEKLNGQLYVLGRYAPHSTYVYDGENVNSLFLLNKLWEDILKAESISRVVEIESIAAKVYWGILSAITIQYKQKAIGEVPEHWNSFGTRYSLLNPPSHRNASNPANALLNYLYALLFAETRHGLLRAGFDTMAGVVHADNQYRDSFVYDVMEAVRPDVDAWLLEFVQNHKFSVKDFYEKRDGGIRLTLKITPVLAETVSLWSEKIESVIEQVEGILINQNAGLKMRRKRKTRI